VANLTYNDLPVTVVRDEEQGMYKFGVTIDGAFIVFGSRKLGGVDDDLRRARDEASQPAPSSGE